MVEGIIMKNLNENISRYINDCVFQKGLDAKTIKAYKIDLDQFNAFSNFNYSSEKNLICSYIESLHSLYKPKTINRKIAVLKAFYNYLFENDIICENPFLKIHPRIKEPVLLPKTISPKLLSDIINSSYKALDECTTEHSRKCVIRDIAVLELLFATGFRVSELCNLKDSNVNISENYVRTIGKGGKERIIQIYEPNVIKALKLYKNLFKNEIEVAKYFFVNRLTKKLSEQSVRFMLNKYVTKAGSSKHITPHMFRHTFATMFLESDVDIRYVQHLLGHSSIKTTEIYTHVSSAKQKEILKKKHPRKNLIINKG